MKISEIITNIRSGAYDDDLEGLRGAVRDRTDAVERSGSAGLMPGDTAVICGDIRPKYLYGLEVTVRKLNDVTVGVEFPDDARCGKFRGATKVRVPRSCVRPA